MAGKVRYSTFETIEPSQVDDNSEGVDKPGRRCCNRCCLCCCCDCSGSNESVDSYVVSGDVWTRRRNGPDEYTEADAAVAEKSLNRSTDDRVNSRLDVVRRDDNVVSSGDETPKTVSRTRFNRRTITLEATIEKLSGFRTKTPIYLRKGDTASSNDNTKRYISSSSTGTDSNDEALGAKPKKNVINFRNVPDITVESHGNFYLVALNVC